jgi:Tfp pilus assembly protein FimV
VRLPGHAKLRRAHKLTVSPLAAQGIEAEIPQARRRRAEELQRKARSPRSGDAPEFFIRVNVLTYLSFSPTLCAWLKK